MGESCPGPVTIIRPVEVLMANAVIGLYPLPSLQAMHNWHDGGIP
jgi:hypothetical protein